jgi:hypothetical protein
VTSEGSKSPSLGPPGLAHFSPAGLLRVYGFFNLFADFYPSLIPFCVCHVGLWLGRIQNSLVILERRFLIRTSANRHP